MHPSSADTGEQYHIKCRHGDLAKCLLVPGDPDRVPKIARFWDESHEVSCHREFRSFTGKYKGVPISAMSSGIGPSTMAILVNEAASAGVETFVRVGSTGAIQKDIKCGDLVISVGAVRLDGTSEHYVRIEFPAVGHYQVLLALIDAAESLSFKYHVGVTATSSDFYAGQERLAFKQLKRSGTDNLIRTLQNAGVLNFEMESATLFVLSSLLGLRAGAVCAVYANRVTNEFEPSAGEENCIKVANEAVKILSDWDQVQQKKKRRWFYPSMLK
ncbi:MAG: uridine phosphorylase [Candidatus Bathyarchaeota archaeon]